MRRMTRTAESFISSEKGAALLMFSSVLVTLGLALSVSVYSGVLSRHQSIGKELKHRQAFWLAEAGLECAMAQFALLKKEGASIHNSKQPSALHLAETRGDELFSLHNCGLEESLELNWAALEEERYLITSGFDRMIVRRTLIFPQNNEIAVSWETGSWSDLE